MPMFVFGYRSNAVGYCHISCCQIKYMLPDFLPMHIYIYLPYAFRSISLSFFRSTEELHPYQIKVAKSRRAFFLQSFIWPADSETNAYTLHETAMQWTIHTVAYFADQTNPKPKMFSQLNNFFNTNPVCARTEYFYGVRFFFSCVIVLFASFFYALFYNLLVYKVQGCNVAGMSYLFMRIKIYVHRGCCG